MRREADRTRTGSKSYIKQGVNVECFLYTNDAGQPCAVGYIGKSDKPRFRYRYRSTADAVDAINEFIARVSANQETDRIRKIEDKKFKKELFDTVEIGSIFVCSWGYDQTNVDAYQVIEKKGAATLVLKEISLSTVEDSDHGHMSCNVIPVKDSFLENSKSMEKRINRYGISLNSYSSASLWNGKDDYYRSWYA